MESLSVLAAQLKVRRKALKRRENLIKDLARKLNEVTRSYRVCHSRYQIASRVLSEVNEDVNSASLRVGSSIPEDIFISTPEEYSMAAELVKLGFKPNLKRTRLDVTEDIDSESLAKWDINLSEMSSDDLNAKIRRFRSNLNLMVPISRAKLQLKLDGLLAERERRS